VDHDPWSGLASRRLSPAIVIMVNPGEIHDGRRWADRRRVEDDLFDPNVAGEVQDEFRRAL